MVTRLYYSFLLITILSFLACTATPSESGQYSISNKSGELDNSRWRWTPNVSGVTINIDKKFPIFGEPSAHISSQALGTQIAWGLANLNVIPSSNDKAIKTTVSVKFIDTDYVEFYLLGFPKDKSPAVKLGSIIISGSSELKPVHFDSIVPPSIEKVYFTVTGRGKANIWIGGISIEPTTISKQKGNKLHSERDKPVVENLNRGIFASKDLSGNVFLSWRFLISDSKDASFMVYRQSNSESPKLLTQTAISTTCYIDKSAPVGGQTTYWVLPSNTNLDVTRSSKLIFHNVSNKFSYKSIRLRGDYKFSKIAVADLDGDGEFDFVIRTPEVGTDPAEYDWHKSKGTYRLEAYRNDGKFLWKYDLGYAIEQGVWYSPFIAYDFDGDGRAEVAAKTGIGDPRDSTGRVYSGEEYLSIIDGQTGIVKAKTEWPSREGFGPIGTGYNNASRNLLTIAYLDGVNPYIIAIRGTYGLIKIHAYRYDGKNINLVWKWDSSANQALYSGQGAHYVQVGDIDKDGRDEIIYGSIALDDDGTEMWSLGLGHPDHVYLGEFDPKRDGYQVYYGYETSQRNNGICLVDARTGKKIWGISESTSHIHDSGLVSQYSNKYDGFLFYSGEKDVPKGKPKKWVHDVNGKLIANESTCNFPLEVPSVFWDKGYTRSLVLDHKILNYDDSRVLGEFAGGAYAYADVLGDWREEIIVSYPGEIRIYSSNIFTDKKMHSLMQDHMYRISAASQSMGYPLVPFIDLQKHASKLKPPKRQ